MGIPDSKVHGANVGPIWGRQDPGGPHVGPMNFAIWVYADRSRKYHSTSAHAFPSASLLLSDGTNLLPKPMITNH